MIALPPDSFQSGVSWESLTGNKWTYLLEYNSTVLTQLKVYWLESWTDTKSCQLDYRKEMLGVVLRELRRAHRREMVRGLAF